MRLITDWFRQHFSDPQAIILTIILLSGLAIILFFGKIIAPVLAAVVIAYLLEGLVALLERAGIPRILAVIIVFLLFMAATIFLLFVLLPIISRQVAYLIRTLPGMIKEGQTLFLQLKDHYPQYISEAQVAAIGNMIISELGVLGQKALSFSLSSVRNIMVLVIYMVLVPLMVFFFMKDKASIMRWLGTFMPGKHSLSAQVWRQVDRQIGNYMRGKFWEILIIWSTSYIAFYMIGLKFAMLTSLITGLSVLVPFIGVTVVAFPVTLVALFQWGLSDQTFYLVLAYVIIQIFDGNLLAPLLLSGVVNLHPIAIILSILVFGGLWGFWGVFFAIPLATLIHAVFYSWPRRGTPHTGNVVHQPPSVTKDANTSGSVN